MSYQQVEQLSQEQIEAPAQENLPPPLSLEETFGSVTPIGQPEDFDALREAAIEEHIQNAVQKLKTNSQLCTRPEP